MTAPALDDRCPTWCADHSQDDYSALSTHQRVLGFAGPIEVALVCWVHAEQPDPVTELEIRSLSRDSSGSGEPVTLPLDGVPLDQLRALLDQALATAGGWQEGPAGA